ncbi:hypothetical protein [Dyella sp. A6]|uniref:hypothetical protein n=1 Tax=Dyella aluminiiresistens TaxID=3069105 RepID=UPI002E782C1F|nr:hypothetical protein [Dyella sp. A6]
MTTYERIAIISSAGLLLIGIEADVVCHAGHWFARSGALVTVVAILFAALDLKDRLSSVPAWVETQLLRSRDAIRQMGKTGGLDDATCETFVDKVVSEVRKDVQCELRKASGRALLVELILFIVGTIVWGFGDLATDLFIASKSLCG